jgi:hypothetical protein
MYWFDTQKHKLPHLHARYKGMEAVLTLDGKLLEGSLGARAEYLVREWVGERQADIHHAWACAVAGKEIPWVLPIQ